MKTEAMTVLGYMAPVGWNAAHEVFVPSNPPLSQIDVEYRRYADGSVMAEENAHGTFCRYVHFTPEQFKASETWKHQDPEAPGRAKAWR